MDLNEALKLVANLGVAGPLVVYLIWRETADRKERSRIAEADIASREKLASALAALSIAITGKPHV